ncbi:MAG: DUF2892 domain-containing protein [Acetobacteraceae bacterium]
MNAQKSRLRVVHNISLSDRGIRWVASATLLAAPAFDLVVSGGSFTWWHGIAMLLSTYPGLTAFLGWDPVYALVDYKTCDLSERNQCGTLPYQVDAAFGNHPIPKNQYDHSLAGAHHGATRRKG